MDSQVIDRLRRQRRQIAAAVEKMRRQLPRLPAARAVTARARVAQIQEAYAQFERCLKLVANMPTVH